AELGPNVLQVSLDTPAPDGEPDTDLGAGETEEDHSDHLDLASREPGRALGQLPLRATGEEREDSAERGFDVTRIEEVGFTCERREFRPRDPGCHRPARRRADDRVA